MPSYTVERAYKEEREPVIQGATFHSYLLTLEGREDKVQILQRPSSDPPKAGDSIEGTIEPGKQKEDGSKWPDKLKRAKTFSGNDGGYRSRDPKETASIVRQHSQTAAVYYAAILQKAHPDIDPHYDWLRGIIDWFFEDAMKAGR